jgi:hypothetical protein
MVLLWIVAAVLAVVAFFRLAGRKRFIALLGFIVFCINIGIASGLLHGFPWT